MEPWVQQIVVPLAVAVLTSSGLWALVSKRADKNDAERKMLVGGQKGKVGLTYEAGATAEVDARRTNDMLEMRE